MRVCPLPPKLLCKASKIQLIAVPSTRAPAQDCTWSSLMADSGNTPAESAMAIAVASAWLLFMLLEGAPRFESGMGDFLRVPEEAFEIPLS